MFKYPIQNGYSEKLKCLLTKENMVGKFYDTTCLLVWTRHCWLSTVFPPCRRFRSQHPLPWRLRSLCSSCPGFSFRRHRRLWRCRSWRGGQCRLWWGRWPEYLLWSTCQRPGRWPSGKERKSCDIICNKFITQAFKKHSFHLQAK